MSRGPKPTRRVRIKIDVVILMDRAVDSVPIGADFVGPACDAICRAAAASAVKRKAGAVVLGHMPHGDVDMALDNRALDAVGAAFVAECDADVAPGEVAP